MILRCPYEESEAPLKLGLIGEVYLLKPSCWQIFFE